MLAPAVRYAAHVRLATLERGDFKEFAASAAFHAHLNTIANRIISDHPANK
ncbi:MAG: hypothetical protein H7251_07095 [Acetobacteraceae bacterium]|nr:hypothetical protein [Acetobacteraceae bacterium]